MVNVGVRPAIGVSLGGGKGVCIVVAGRGVRLGKMRVTAIVLAAVNASPDGVAVKVSDIVHPVRAIKSVTINRLVVEKHLPSCMVSPSVISDY